MVNEYRLLMEFEHENTNWRFWTDSWNII